MARGGIQKRGKSWRARWVDPDGKEREKSFPRRGLAEAHLRAQLAAIHAGTYVDPAAGSVTFEEYSTAWLSQQHVRRSSHELMERRLRLQIWPTLGDLPLSRLRRGHIVAMVTRCSKDEGLSPSVTRHALSMVRAILDAAVADRLIPSNPARDRTIPMPRAERQPYTPLSDADVAAIAGAMEDRHRALVVLMAASGLRPGEAFGLTADRLSPPVHLHGDLLPRQVTVRIDRQAGPRGTFAPPKTPSSVRDVTVPGSVVAVLAAHVERHGLGPDGLLFTTASGRMISRGRASEIWARATKDLELPDGATFHDLRHFHASALLSQGISIAYVSKRLGHANAAITLGIYAHALPRDDERVLDASDEIARRLA